MIDLRPYIVGACLGAAGLLYLPLSGLLPSSAEPDQPAVLDWYFNLAAEQSIALRSLSVDVPPLDVPGRMERGAGHYELVCADCHGSPSTPPQQFADNLSPSPPLLVDRMAQWHPKARIFATIKYGIRHTAMPGWPTQMRDDEIWDMVAFLETLPDIDQVRYASMVADDCSGCHGDAGQGAVPGIPRLDIQSPGYIESSLKAFRDGTRESGTMIAVARVLSDAQIKQLATSYGKTLTAPAATGPGEVDAIVRFGIQSRDIPACDACHGSNARPGYPRLEGQDAAYLLSQLKLFKELGADRGGPNAPIMAQVARLLDEDEMKSLAEWYGK